MSETKVLVVVGMQAEAALLPKHAAVVVSGGDQEQLKQLLAQQGQGLAGVISFGIAGGLDPALKPGDLVVATRVRGRSGAAFPADGGWAARLARLSSGRLGVVAGATEVVGDPAAKRALHAATGALAVDLETLEAAAFAARHQLPFAALRAVADTAGDAVPLAAAKGLKPDGRPATGRVLLALMRRPHELKPLLQVARQTRTALHALSEVAQHLPPPR